ncbi:MAG: metalloregulator ArsR/SmtB family transcription factor [Chloroflexota bacterium]
MFTDLNAELLAFFKALADANRLKIIGLLSQERYTVEQLAAMLDLRPSTVSHHLSKLAEVGLVSARAEGYYNIYQLEKSTLETMSRRLLAEDMLPAFADNVDVSAFERKVVSDYSLPDGRLKTIPAQHKKLLAVLNHIVRQFEPDKIYSEKQVNTILSRFHDDTATLRRELVGNKLMVRKVGGKDYQRVSE